MLQNNYRISNLFKLMYNIDVRTPLTFTFKPQNQVKPPYAGYSDASYVIKENKSVTFKAVFSSPVTVGVIQTSPLDADILLLYHQRVGEIIKTLVETCQIVVVIFILKDSITQSINNHFQI